MTDKEKVEAILKILDITLPDVDLDDERTCKSILRDLEWALDDWRLA